eukprot:175387_1
MIMMIIQQIILYQVLKQTLENLSESISEIFINSNNNNNQTAPFTFIPSVHDQPLPAYSSQPTIPSPKTHFHSPNKLNNISHNKQSQSYSPMAINNNNNNNKNNKNNSFNSSPSNIHQPSKSHPNISPINTNNNKSSHPLSESN